MGSLIRCHSRAHRRFLYIIIMKKFNIKFRKGHIASGDRSTNPSLWHSIGNDPHIDWVIIFILACLSAALFVWVGVGVYLDSQDKFNTLTPIIPTGNSHFDAKSLESITKAFDDRAAQRVLLEHGYSGPSDPSLP